VSGFIGATPRTRCRWQRGIYFEKCYNHDNLSYLAIIISSEYHGISLYCFVRCLEQVGRCNIGKIDRSEKVVRKLNSIGQERLSGAFHEILEIAETVRSGASAERIVDAVLGHLSARLGKRARCALLEGEDLRLRFWAGTHSCPVDGVKIRKESVVWEAVRKGEPINVTKVTQIKDYKHSLEESINIKSVIPLNYVDPLTGKRRNLGALIVDSGESGEPISHEDFEYLQVIGLLISTLIGRVTLVRQLLDSCHRQDNILKETAHNFRNSITVVGGFSRRIEKLATGTELAGKARDIQEEIRRLEGHLLTFEKLMRGT
jgi:hypothetical protein